jgi:hypothetical protein
VPLQVSFDSPLTVTTGTNDALDLEFDLAHPAFIVGHTPPAADGNNMWAIDFNGPLRPHRVHDLRNLVLRHTYGTVTAVSSDNTSITITKDFPFLLSGYHARNATGQNQRARKPRASRDDRAGTRA